MEPLSPQLERLLADNVAAQKRGTTKTVVLGSAAIDALAPYFTATFPDTEAIVVSDDHTFHAAALTVETALADAGITARRLILEPRHGDDHLVAEDGVITAFQTLLAASPGIAIAVGAGTINDIVKYASFKLGREYIAVPTAASMNGYTSTIAAVLVGGVKRTLPCDQPVAIFADTDVLQAAPPHLNQAGFGDLLSKPVSQGDWILSHLVRDVPYSTRPNDILEELFAELLVQAPAIGRADAHGLSVLMQAILVSGFSMAVAGSSAPASGGEHLVSHYWDMEQLDHGAPLLGLHGTQVGVATRLSAMLFERLLGIDPATIDPSTLAANAPTIDTLSSKHSTLSAPIVSEIKAQLTRKQKVGDDLIAELTKVQALWPEIIARITPVMLTVTQIERALADAGCIDRPSRLGCDAARAIHTLRVCRQMRDRYVALDLMDDLGLLEGWAEAAVTRAEAS